MIITCDKGSSDKVISRLAKSNIPCVAVGELCEKQNGITLIENDKKSDLKYFEEDPYWTAFFNALKGGWK